MTWFWRYMNYLATWREHRKAIKQLNQMSDRELNDLGISRADIDRLVWLDEDKQKRGASDWPKKKPASATAALPCVRNVYTTRITE